MKEVELLDNLENNKEDYLKGILLSGLLQEAINEIKQLSEIITDLTNRVIYLESKLN